MWEYLTSTDPEVTTATQGLNALSQGR
jgi:hypothetical protein